MMTRSEFARQAFEECCSAETTVRYGSKRGAPFWNQEATMFMYVPAFQFTSVRGCRRYLYRAVDENGGVHTFEADNCCALLTPIWSELPEGMIRLSVTALLPDGSEPFLISRIGTEPLRRLNPASRTTASLKRGRPILTRIYLTRPTKTRSARELRSTLTYFKPTRER